MALPLTYFEQLIDEELAGVISPEDQLLLNNAKIEDPIVRKLWEKSQALFADKETQDWLAAERVPPAVSMAPVFKRKKRMLIVACIMPLVISIAYFLNSGGRKTYMAITVTALRLDNGEAADLSQDSKGKLGSISFNNQHRSLTYMDNSSAAKWATLTVPARKEYNITLSDGTQVFLNAASSIRFPSSFKHAPTREVSITGEAFFIVAKDASRPFIVNSAEGTVKVLGTSFNINSYDKGNLQVALVDGAVKLMAGKDSVLLKPGSVATAANGSIQTGAFDAAELLSWRKGIFQFTNKTVEDVCRIIPRWFDQQVIIDNKEIAKKCFSGIFDKSKSIQKNLDDLKEFEGIDYYIDKDNVIHIK